ncbi:hypothetical protein L1887_22230 [Cichorium endivia]|nr:hypothetical protein L1887_22230 [Cichorium endivia]
MEEHRRKMPPPEPGALDRVQRSLDGDEPIGLPASYLSRGQITIYKVAYSNICPFFNKEEQMVGLLAFLGPLATVCSKIGEWLADPVKNQYGYLFNYTTNIGKLRDGVEDLENRRASVQNSVDAAMRNLEVIKPDVLAWMNGVDDLKKEADKVLQASTSLIQKWLWCFGGRFLNIKSRYSRSRKAVKMMEVVIQLQEKYKFTNVSDPPVPVEITDFKHLSYSEGFVSRVSIRNEIMESLKDDDVYVIGMDNTKAAKSC